MNYFVYIIQSEVDGSFYKGFFENYHERLVQHNAGKSNYTSGKTPWRLVYVEVFESKSDAIRREKNLKKAAHERINAIISMPKNILLGKS